MLRMHGGEKEGGLVLKLIHKTLASHNDRTASRCTSSGSSSSCDTLHHVALATRTVYRTRRSRLLASGKGGNEGQATVTGQLGSLSLWPYPGPRPQDN